MVSEEIAEMIAKARHVQPFNVGIMKKEDIYDIFAQCDTFLNTSPIKISTASWIKISRAICLLYKLRQPSVTWNQGRSITSLKEESLSMTSPEFTLYRHLEKGQPLVILKKDLLSMLKFDTKYHTFYRQLCT
ncbi:hypothetical protein TNCT_653461 [Trichonephila clavata]|uniref:Uncharacterized protein n=1 Tax=Trichonephila clavata TaxID=2740835 RepID=A0A8X6G730_TRICU|nr:hypothetical protein TNCT_653461 [Trichonephila clavata]